MKLYHQRTLLLTTAAGTGILGVVGALQLGALIDGTRAPHLNPLAGLLQVVLGRPKAGPATWVLLAVVALVTLVLLALAPKKNTLAQKEKAANARLGGRSQFRKASADARMMDNETNLHQHSLDGVGPGLPIGVSKGKTIYQGWRQCGLQIQGTGRGKTTSQVIPHALAAPGPVVVTSNKVDGIWEIIADRMFKGEIYIFDPTNILGRENPGRESFDLLSMIRTSEDAEKVGMIFEAATKGKSGDHGNINAHFDREGAKVLGTLMLAAQLGGLSDQDIFNWVVSSDPNEAIDILRREDLTNQASRLEGLKKQPADTKGSVWATAQRCASPFEHAHIMDGIRPRGIPGEKLFDSQDFVSSTDTLILLGDRKRAGSAALVSALVWDIFQAAAAQAAKTTRGRLPTPLVMELDEVGNAVFLPDLADWFSYAGSLGVVITGYLQSYAQGVKTWSKDEFESIYSGAAMFVYGGGSRDDKFLDSVSKVIGDYEHIVHNHSTSRTRGHRSSSGTSTHRQQRKILSVSDLAFLSPGTILVMSGDGEIGLAEARYWFNDKTLVNRLGPQIERLKENSGIRAYSKEDG